MLRNNSFPDDQASRSYLKQLPHMRALKYRDGELIGYFGLDYRAIGVADSSFKVLGIIDFCVDKSYRGQGIGSSMLHELSHYAKTKDVDFIILISELNSFYTRNGFQQITAPNSWLRLDEHKNYGVAFEEIDELYIKPISGKIWMTGHVDWLGYMF